MVTFDLTKTENRTKTQLSYYCTIVLNHTTIFVKKMLMFSKKYADISKIKVVLVLKYIFFETTYVCGLLHQFQICSIIVMSFRQGVILPPTAKGTPKTPQKIVVQR